MPARFCAEGCGELAPLAPWCEHEWEALVEGVVEAADDDDGPREDLNEDNDLGGEAGGA